MVGKPKEPHLVPLWPDAGMRLGYRSRSATYAAEAKGLIPIVRLGKLKKVSTAWLDRKTAGAAEGDQATPAG
jgi:hypothetical protein